MVVVLVLAGVGGEVGGRVGRARQNVGPIGAVGDEITGLCRGERSREGFVDAEVFAEAATHGGRRYLRVGGSWWAGCLVLVLVNRGITEMDLKVGKF